MTDLLLVVDVQVDFLPGGALPVPGGDRVVAPVNALIARAPFAVLTQDWHPPGHVSFADSHPGRRPSEAIDLAYGPQTLWPAHCVQGTPGAAFASGLDADRAGLVVRKGMNRQVDSYSAFMEADRATPTGLAGALRERGVGRVVVCGLATDYCVLWSALDAASAGFSVGVVEDAVAGIHPDSVAQAWARMTAAGIARLRTSEIA